VLVFSHGYTGYVEQNTVQMEELASRGYVVASIAHPGEASWAPLPGGRGVPFSPALKAQRRRRKPERKGLRTDMCSPDVTVRRASFVEYLDTFHEPLRSESLHEWTQDTRVVVDHLEDLHAGVCASGFQGKLDLSRLGVFGMSYGGATAVEFARTDARCRAAVNLDGSCFGGLVTGTLATPLLIMSSTLDRPVQVPVLDRVSGPVHLATVPDTSHGAFTDLPLIFPRWMRRSRLVGRMDAMRRLAIMNDCIVTFFDMHLLQRGSAAFDALPRRYPEVSWASRPTRGARAPVVQGAFSASLAGEVSACGSNGGF
jgi:predicted dienelactone hydrolase